MVILSTLDDIFDHFSISREREAETLGLFLSDDDLVGLPLKSRSVEISIYDSGTASISESLTYSSTKENPVEVTFRLPLPNKAVLCDLSAKLADREIKTVVKKAETAQRDYDEAVSQGHSAVHMKKASASIYSLCLGNLAPSETCTILFTYVQRLDELDNVIEMKHCSTWVPPYVAKADDVKKMEDEEPRFHSSKAYELSFDVHIYGGHNNKKIESVFSPYIRLDNGEPLNNIPLSSEEGADEPMGEASEVHFHIPNAQADPSQDFSVMVTYAGGSESYCITEPANSAIDSEFPTAMFSFRPNVGDHLSADEKATKRKEIVFVVDGSGSMHGSPISYAREALSFLVKDLPTDGSIHFNIVMFGSSHKSMFTEPRVFDAGNCQQAENWIGMYVHANFGGTQIFSVLKSVYDVPLAANVSRCIVFLTDGGVSQDQQEQCVQLVREHGNAGRTSVMCLGIGHGVHMGLLEGIAANARGQVEHVADSKSIDRKCAYLKKCALNEGISELSLKPRGCLLRTAPSQLPPVLFDGQTLNIYAEIRGVDESSSEDAVVELCGRYPDKTEFKQTVTLRNGSGNKQSLGSGRPPVLPYLYAMARIHDVLEREASTQGDHRLSSRRREISESAKDEIVDISVRYGIVTDYASRIGICVRRDPVDSSKVEKVEVPIQTPHGRTLWASGSDDDMDAFVGMPCPGGGAHPRGQRRGLALQKVGAAARPKKAMVFRKKSSGPGRSILNAVTAPFRGLFSQSASAAAMAPMDAAPAPVMMRAPRRDFAVGGLPPDEDEDEDDEVGCAPMEAMEEAKMETAAAPMRSAKLSSEPKDAKSVLVALNTLRTADGCWVHVGNLCATVGVPADRCATFHTELREDIRATALALGWMLAFGREHKSLCAGMEQKALQWLKDALASVNVSNSATALVFEAKALVSKGK